MSIDTDLSAQSAQTPDAKARKSPSTARSLMSILAWLVILSYFSPYWGKMACGLIAVVSLIAMIRPLPSLGLSSWAVSLASFLMLGVFGGMVAGVFSLFSVTTEAAQDATKTAKQASPAAAVAPITEPGAPQKTPVADYAQLYAAVTREEWLRASNLLDAEARVHASPLKDLVPLPGRSLRLGVRLEFGD